MNANETKTFQSSKWGKVEVFNQNDVKLLITTHAGSRKGQTFGIVLADLESANIPQALWNEVVANLG